MIADIAAINTALPINNKYATVTVPVTGIYSRILVRENMPADLTIANIQYKFDNRFDNPSYYYGGGGADGGDVA